MSLSGRLREIPKVAAVGYGNGCLQGLFITKFKSEFNRGFTKVVVTGAGRLREWSQGEFRLQWQIDRQTNKPSDKGGGGHPDPDKRGGSLKKQIIFRPSGLSLVQK